MENQQDINAIINNLLIRNFDIQTIKEYPKTNGYETTVIETALNNVAKTRESKSKNYVTIKEGFSGFRYIFIGIIILFTSTTYKSLSANAALNFLKILLGICSIIYGVFIALRPMKDKT